MPRSKSSHGSGGKQPRKLNIDELREFRHRVSQLKAKGVVSKRVDARSQRATRYMTAKVRRFESVASGESVAFKLKREQLEAYKDAGYEVHDNRLVVRKERGIKTSVERGLLLKRRKLANGEIEQVVLPFTSKNLHTLKRRASEMDKLKNPDEVWSFKYKGHLSTTNFTHFEDLVEWLEHYPEADADDDEDGSWLEEVSFQRTTSATYRRLHSERPKMKRATKRGKAKVRTAEQERARWAARQARKSEVQRDEERRVRANYAAQKRAYEKQLAQAKRSHKRAPPRPRWGEI